MADQQSDIELLAVRMTKLEKQNRLMRLSLIALAGAFTLFVALALAIPDDETIEAKSFVLRDGNDRPRAVLRVRDDDEAGLFILDNTGKARAELGVAADGSAGMLLNSKEGHPTIGVVATPTAARFCTFDQQGTMVWMAPESHSTAAATTEDLSSFMSSIGSLAKLAVVLGF